MAYLPEVYKDFKKQYPKIARGYDSLALACHAWGPLDEKSRRLVKLGIAIGLNSEGGVRSHVRRGLAEGITPDEIRHAVLLAFTTTGFPTMIASLKWAEEVIAKKK
jgi:alkylhydroperoxidase/carboxymuconolactone decarboxylase family protein YurZ